MANALAYVDSKDKTMTFLPEGETHTYRTNLEVETGLHKVDYNVETGEKGIRIYDIYYLNGAEPATPRDPEVLFRLIEEITGFADRIVPKLEGLPADSSKERVEKALRRISDREWLEGISGIGPAYSESLAEKFSSVVPEELDVFAAFRRHGLPYNRGNAREAWACALMSSQPEELEAFENDPYHLMRIGDKSRKPVKQAARDHPDMTLMRYSLTWIDRHVSQRWKQSPERARAHLESAVKGAFSEGHTVVRLEQIARSMRQSGLEVIGLPNGQEKRVDQSVVKSLVSDNDRVRRARYITKRGDYEQGFTTEYKREQAYQLSTVLAQMMQFDQPYSDWERREMEGRAINAGASFELDDTQKTAIRQGFRSRVSAITGAAGTGKTTTLQRFLRGAAQLLEGRRDRQAIGEDYTRPPFCFYVLAPSGKAAKQARSGISIELPNGRVVEPGPIDQEAMPEGEPEEGHVQAGTIHSFLGYRGVGQWNIPDPHPAVVIVDEMSMTGLDTAYHLGRFLDALAAYEMPGMLLLLGDNNQLEPVEAGAPFRDVLGKVGDAVIPSTELSYVHRQGAGSATLEASRRVLGGDLVPAPQEVERSGLEPDFFWHTYPRQMPSAYEYMRAVAERASGQLGRAVRPAEVQLILPLRRPSSVDPGAFCAREVNKSLQDAFAERRGASVEAFPAASLYETGRQYTMWLAEGDRVAHVGENGYAGEDASVMRGTVGRVVRADGGEKEIAVEYPAEGIARYSEPEEISQLELAWAITGHVSQGSEYEVCAVALPKKAGEPLMTRSWLYTALTRSTGFMDLLATPERVQMCAGRDLAGDRQTLLSRAPGL